ncbi:MAG: hypothetical protein N2663_04690 [Chlorobi bacterium]|nr:hypothetical protein [Chlorobiota bacterium]
MIARVLLGVLLTSVCAFAQRSSTGFGIILGDPTGLTLKHWVTRDQAIAASVGGSYFGSPRIGVDYMWHFNAFRSSIVSLYGDGGIALGFGKGVRWWGDRGYKYYDRNETRIGVRGMFGVNVLPRGVPLEIFLELGPLVAIAPGFGSSVDVALGIRFYP